MHLELYKKDFTPQKYKDFYDLYIDAVGARTVELVDDNRVEDIVDYGEKRDKQYLKVGQEVVKRSDFMLFLWDEVINYKTGGTADIVEYAKEVYQDNFNEKHHIVKCKRENL